jgi:hypothetical protein
LRVKRNMLINIEEFHARCLFETVSFSWKFMEEKFGNGECWGILTKPSDDEKEDVLSLFEEETIFSCDVIGKIKLPYGSDRLINTMALFSKATLSHITKVNGMDWEKLPQNTFCLSSLLQAGFPKNVLTGIFKAHDGAFSIGDQNYPDFQGNHVAFSGIGIILMNETRKILSPLSPDSEIVAMTEEVFLSISEEEK